MPTTIILNDRLLARLRAAANDMAQPLDVLIERFLEDVLIDVECSSDDLRDEERPPASRGSSPSTAH